MYQNDHTGHCHAHGHGQTNTHTNASKPPATPSAHRSSPTASNTQSPSTLAGSPLPLPSPASTTSSSTASASSAPRYGVHHVLGMREPGRYVSTLHIEGTDGDDGMAQEQTNRHGCTPLYEEWSRDHRIYSEQRVTYSFTSSREVAIALTARSIANRSAFSDGDGVGTGNGHTGSNTAGPHS